MTMTEQTYNRLQHLPPMPDVPPLKFDQLGPDDQRSVLIAMCVMAMTKRPAEPAHWLLPTWATSIQALIDKRGDDLMEPHRDLLAMGLDGMMSNIAERHSRDEYTDRPEVLLAVLALLRSACRSFSDDDWYANCADSARWLYDKLGFTAHDCTAWLEQAASIVLADRR